MDKLTKQIMDSKQGIDAIFQFATEGILLTNSKSEIIHINPSAERLFGYNSKELIGQKIEVLLPKRFQEKHVSHRDTFNKKPNARSMGAGMNLFAARKDGREFPVEISLSPYESEGEKFVVAFIIDITLRKESEEKLKNYSSDLEKQVGYRTLILQEAITELEKTKIELNEALEKGKELNELKSRFVSMASHEFRTPLATIMSSLSLVKAYGDKGDMEKQGKHIGKIKNSIANLTDILNDFLSVSKLEEGKVENECENIEIDNFLFDIINEMNPLCKDGQQLIYKHEGEKLFHIAPKLIKHILFNLISNALKFSPESSNVEIYTKVFERKLILEIKDYGIGISETDQKQLFERFFRARNASNIQGTGLGLNIVASYVELMNGKVEVFSKENVGTTFKLTFTN